MQAMTSLVELTNSHFSLPFVKCVHMVPKAGLEPARIKHLILSQTSLPISSLGQIADFDPSSANSCQKRISRVAHPSSAASRGSIFPSGEIPYHYHLVLLAPHSGPSIRFAECLAISFVAFSLINCTVSLLIV